MKMLSVAGQFVLIVSLSFLNRAILAEEYLGATALIKELQTEQDKSPQEAKGEEPDAFAKRVEEYTARAAELSHQDAASQWLELVDAIDEGVVDPVEFYYDQSDSDRGLAQVVKALPGPDVWPALREAIESRPARDGQVAVREYALQMLVHVLLGDKASQQRDLEGIEQSTSDLIEQGSNQQWAYLIQQLASAMAQAASDPELSISLLESRLEAQMGSADFVQQEVLSIPDLVTLLGPERAEKMLRKVLASPIVIEISVGVETKQLSRRLALEMIEKLEVAQWGLCDSIEATDLFEALTTRFVKPAAEKKAKKQKGLGHLLSRLVGLGEEVFEEDSTEQITARIYYFLGLIVKDRTKEAAEFVPQVFSEDNYMGNYWFESARKKLRKAGHSEQLYQFFKELLTRNPKSMFWESYIDLAAETGHGKEMLEHVRNVAESEKIDSTQLHLLRRHLRDAYLAVDDVEAGVALLRKELTESEATAEGNDEVFDAALKLAKLGKLLGKPEWIDEGLRHARKTLFDNESEGNYWSQYYSRTLVTLLLDMDRGPEAEKICKQVIQETLMAPAKSDLEWMDPSTRTSGLQESLALLLHVYANAGRVEDVKKLLDEAPWWGVKDLAELETEVESFSMDVANSLAQQGIQDAALQLVRKKLRESPGEDRAYQLLTQIEGQKALAFLDRLILRDRFEERPLIWKARLMLEAGKVDEAEKFAREAIAIDPSDGEQGKGDRMRVYAVLADVYQTRGDEKQEEFFRGVVRAIRLAENADDFYEAGLKMRGVAKYREALLQFADAYCIESRLAIQLGRLGMMEEAAKHYQRAFELMPDSFGRVESHCFGCENAFQGNLAQQTAEQVFARIAKANPQKPQIHYLIGYLRETQQRFPEALEAYQQAVKLDPDYLNAWKKLLEIREYIFLPRDIQNETTINVMRLDPLGKHSSPPTGSMTDLARLWRVFSEFRPEPIEVPETIYPLRVSRKLLEEHDRVSRDVGFNALSSEHVVFHYESNSWDEENKPDTPGELIAQNDIIRSLSNLFDLANSPE